MKKDKDELYAYIERYAEKKQLVCTLASLKLVQEVCGHAESVANMNVNGIIRYRGHYEHALSVCKLLISLRIPLEMEEEDVVLSAALCHIIPNQYGYPEMKRILLKEYQMDERICEIISLIINDNDLSNEGQSTFYGNIKENRLALLVFLADRANLVQQLYTMSIWTAKEYIYETRSYFFPICIYAKENYPELMPVLNILMDKVRTLVDACMILLNRYEIREMELAEDILNLQEENSRMSGLIEQMKTNQV